MKHIHFIAIGGAIMHQLAIALQKQGYQVTGSDDEINDPAKTNLANAGLLPEQNGWYAEKITPSIDAVVLGMHAKKDNPELIAAKAAGKPIYSFPQYVYEVCKDKQRIVIAGSHGKTTITSMVMHILKDNNIVFDFLVGAKVPGFDASVQLSDAPLIIIEGDEYPASVEEKRPKIFFYRPHITLISGIAWDHINVFPTYENYFSQFTQYIDGLDAGTKLLYNVEDTEVVKAVSLHGGHTQATPYVIPQYHYEEGTPVINTENGFVNLSVFGRHNVLNVQAAVAICKSLGITEAQCYASIAHFTGAAKRLEKISATNNLLVYRDFAHAPSKLHATLNAVREAYAGYYLIACFELHTYSSLNENFLAEYAHSMDSADAAIVYFSKHALELKGLPFLEKETVKTKFRREDLTVTDEKEQLLSSITALVAETDIPVFLLLMSSGTFDGIDWNSLSSQLKQ